MFVFIETPTSSRRLHLRPLPSQLLPLSPRPPRHYIPSSPLCSSLILINATYPYQPPTHLLVSTPPHSLSTPPPPNPTTYPHRHPSFSTGPLHHLPPSTPQFQYRTSPPPNPIDTPVSVPDLSTT